MMMLLMMMMTLLFQSYSLLLPLLLFFFSNDSVDHNSYSSCHDEDWESSNDINNYPILFHKTFYDQPSHQKVLDQISIIDLAH